MDHCPCGSGKEYEACCGEIIGGNRAAPTAEALMRSRYSAFVNDEIDYLRESLHPDHRRDYDNVATRQWAKQTEWEKQEVDATTGGGEDYGEGTVEFIATLRQKGSMIAHLELGNFVRQYGRWYYAVGKLITPGTGRGRCDR